MQKISRIICYCIIKTCFFGKFFLLAHRSGSSFWLRRLAAGCFFIFLNLLLPLYAAEAKDLSEVSSHCQATREKANEITARFIKFTLVQTGKQEKFRLLNAEELERAMNMYDVLIEHINCLEEKLKNKPQSATPGK